MAALPDRSGSALGQITDANYEGKREAMMKLSPREREVLALYIAEGQLKRVAEMLGRSIYTIRHQHESAMRKLGARNAVELTQRAIQKGWVKG